MNFQSLFKKCIGASCLAVSCLSNVELWNQCGTSSWKRCSSIPVLCVVFNHACLRQGSTEFAFAALKEGGQEPWIWYNLLGWFSSFILMASDSTVSTWFNLDLFDQCWILLNEHALWLNTFMSWFEVIAWGDHSVGGDVSPVHSELQSGVLNIWGNAGAFVAAKDYLRVVFPDCNCWVCVCVCRLLPVWRTDTYILRDIDWYSYYKIICMCIDFCYCKSSTVMT